MNTGRPDSSTSQEISLQPTAGWHCSHLYYTFDRGGLTRMPEADIRAGREELIALLDPSAPGATARLQVSVVSGHKADFGLMLMDADPLKSDAVQQHLLASRLGAVLRPGYSFVSMSEVSEYVPTVSQYADRLLQDGEQQDSPAFKTKVRAYESRLPMMNRQRLTPEFPVWPATCFYPMNKRRDPQANWFTLPFAERNRMMAEHARSGMEFAGKVSQLITVGVGLDDWEWGVTLWARNPQFLKDIVYRMRFDEASARYAEFGPFYVSYVMSADAMLDHCRIGNSP
jgi:hydrogen peroxide-dependent heme synthase